ncbi:nuclease-related domain-containing protein [Paraburkholderia agricolaris]|uniref:Nuclease-related domain-containing protein n=1 Tax=Paraburkholderia agricolaris TaxID=2152888 RepID=A0ABW9A345_9BURK
MPIEIFCRYTRGATNTAERRVLSNAVDILERNQHSAVVLCDFYSGGQQIDLLVATEITTLVLQVKSYRHAVEGTTNSAYWRNPATGASLPNGYTQATDQMFALKDMLRQQSGRDPGFARAAVLFEQGIPVGSSLPQSDFRVQICDLQGLEALLLTPTSGGSSRVPWNLELLRKYAIQEGMARLPDFATRKPVDADSIAVPFQALTEPRLIKDARTVTDVKARPDRLKDVAPPVRQHVFIPVHQHATGQTKHLRHIPQSVFGLTAILIGTGLGWFARHVPEPAKPMTSDTQSLGPIHHSGEAKHRHDRIAKVNNKSPASTPPIKPTTTAMAQAPSLMSSAPPFQPCPEGVDRLGCTPSAETLTRLRGQ